MTVDISSGTATSTSFPSRVGFRPGMTIFKEGQLADAAYIIETGHVEFFKMVAGRRVPMGTAGPWELFGAAGLLDNGPRNATACALDEVRCFVVSRQAMDAMMDGAHDGLLVVVERLVHALRALSDELAEARFQLLETRTAG
jgi:CRP-like cAMP-binding protein